MVIQSRRLRFSLRTLFVVMTLCALASPALPTVLEKIREWQTVAPATTVSGSTVVVRNRRDEVWSCPSVSSVEPSSNEEPTEVVVPVPPSGPDLHELIRSYLPSRPAEELPDRSEISQEGDRPGGSGDVLPE